MEPDVDLNKEPPPTSPHPSGRHLGDTVPLAQQVRPTRPLKVFLVEDETLVRERVIEKIAAGRAKIVDHAESAAAAIVKLRESPWDVVILDLELKHGTGFQVLREVRSNDNSRPWIIVFTHFTDAHFRKQTMALGADHFLDKAQDLDSLAAIIERLPVVDGGNHS